METYRVWPGSSTFREAAWWFGSTVASSYWRKGFSKGESLKSGAIVAAGVVIADLARQISS